MSSRTIRALALAAVLLPCAGKAQSRGVQLTGIGYRNCAEYLSTDRESQLTFAGWAGGVIAAYSTAYKNEAGNIDFQDMLTAVNAYCREHPAENFGVAVGTFYRSVTPAAGKRT